MVVRRKLHGVSQHQQHKRLTVGQVYDSDVADDNKAGWALTRRLLVATRDHLSPIGRHAHRSKFTQYGRTCG